MSKLFDRLKKELKEMFLTPQGWIGWIIANIITSLPWAIPLVYGFVFKDNNGYVIAGSIWTFLMLPFTPAWAVNVAIAVPIKSLLLKNKRGIVIKGE
jgi:hypothetical protein